MLINKTVMIKWRNMNKDYYINKGYFYTKLGDEFEVNVEDLLDKSAVYVDVKCDNCGEVIRNVTWYNYKKYVHDDGKYYCQKCAQKLFGFKKALKTRLKNSKSFYEWCYLNLTKELADWILSRWDYELNNCNPQDVSFNSKGINKKGYWFKCFDHLDHESEQKNIQSFVNGHNGSITCNKCNKIRVTNPELIKLLVNEEDANKYSMGSNDKIPVKCPICKYEKEKSISNIIRDGGNICCPRCSDGLPYPEKFMFSFLEQLETDFIIQISKNKLKWCQNYRYDNYINNINCIIGTHGRQHYELSGIKWRTSLEDIQNNDKDKEILAKQNGVENYIIIDCRESNLEWIKNSIMQSKLPELLNFKESDINWLKCHEFSCNSLVKSASDLWKDGINSALQISNILKIDRNTVSNYLKRGVELGWCDYDPNEELRKVGILMGGHNAKKIICITTGEIFDNQYHVANKYNIDQSSISRCCKGEYKSAGKHPDTGEKLVWKFYNEGE